MRDHSLERWVRRLWMPLAGGGAAAAGVLAGLVGAGEPSLAHLKPETGHPAGYDQDEYTFEGSDCSSFVDPINIVFVGLEAQSQYVRAHAEREDHGGWDDHSQGSDQYFWDHGQCQLMDDQSADAGGLIPATRYHMRYNQGDINGVQDWDEEWGYYALAAVHHEIGGLAACNIGFPNYDFYAGHAVDGNDTNGAGGFNMGREWLTGWFRYNNPDGHDRVVTEDWGNELHMKQCDQGYAWSDGFVYHITMPAPPPSGGGSACGRGAFVSNC